MTDMLVPISDKGCWRRLAVTITSSIVFWLTLMSSAWDRDVRAVVERKLAVSDRRIIFMILPIFCPVKGVKNERGVSD